MERWGERKVGLAGYDLTCLHVVILPVGMKSKNGDMMQGTLDLLILRILVTGERHGYSIARRIEQISEDALTVPQGSLYPALQRLLKKGLIEAQWGMTETNRKARIYKLTQLGEKQFEEEASQWKAFIQGVTLVMDNA